MSWKAINAAWGARGMSSTEKLVLVCMANYANAYDADITFVSQETIARECALTVRTVITAQKSLTEKMQISLADKTGRSARGDARTRFKVHPTGETASPVTHENDSADTRNQKLSQVKSTVPTPENDGRPNITTMNPPNQGGTGTKDRPHEKLEYWKLNRELDDVSKRILSEKEKAKPDREILAAWRQQRSQIKDELRARGRAALSGTDADATTDDLQRPKKGRNFGTLNNPAVYAGITSV